MKNEHIKQHMFMLYIMKTQKNAGHLNKTINFTSPWIREHNIGLSNPP